jgi:tetratricopeptide (TPR) repeat protein
VLGPARLSILRFALPSLLLLALAAPALAQIGALRGQVTDADGEPLAGVRVTVTSPGQESIREVLTTGADGKFLLRFTANQAQHRHLFLFEKAGYQPFEQPIQPPASRVVRETFVMEEARGQAVASHGALGSVLTGTTNAAVAAFNAGLTAQREGDLTAARAKLEEALAADPDLGPAHVALAQVLLDQREHEAALEHAERAQELGAAGTEALRVEHQSLLALGRRDEAAAVGEELAAAENAQAAALRVYNEGGEAFAAGDRETALARFVAAAELDPALREAHHAIATLRLAQGDAAAAAEAAEKALALGSDDLATLRVLFDAYDTLGRHEELASIAPRLAAVDPDFGGAKLLEQAARLWNAGESEGAAALSRQAVAIDPSLAKAWYFIGLHHLGAGENEEARAALETFLAAAPDDPDAEAAKEMLAFLD